MSDPNQRKSRCVKWFVEFLVFLADRF